MTYITHVECTLIDCNLMRDLFIKKLVFSGKDPPNCCEWADLKQKGGAYCILGSQEKKLDASYSLA